MTNFDIYDISGAESEAMNLAKNNPYKTILAITILFAVLILFIIFVVLYIIEKNKNDELQTELNNDNIDTTQLNDNSLVSDDLNGDASNDDASNDDASKGEPFTNDLPYQLNNESISLVPENDYNETLQKMSLDSAVFSQHAKHVKDGNKITSTASFSPSRSDNQDIVTTWGLSKPAYISIDPSARNVPSQDPEQGSKPLRLQWK